ncbi:hypothetical protein D3C81_1332800 [compost metagenome]
MRAAFVPLRSRHFTPFGTKQGQRNFPLLLRQWLVRRALAVQLLVHVVNDFAVGHRSTAECAAREVHCRIAAELLQFMAQQCKQWCGVSIGTGIMFGQNQLFLALGVQTRPASAEIADHVHQYIDFLGAGSLHLRQ